MPEVLLRPKARADLDDIWDYTVEELEANQAMIPQRIDNLRKMQDAAGPCSSIPIPS